MHDLSTILRPKKLEDFVGQKHLLDKNASLFLSIQNKKIPHSFFFGPPGSGKTTLANLIANELDQPFIPLNGVDFKLENLRTELKTYSLAQPIIFIDEVHRLTRNQQEFLLPIMETNQAIIIGASTENPFYTLTQAIRSRSMLFELFPLSNKNLEEILQKALQKIVIDIDEDAKTYLIQSSNGDARAMLYLLYIASNHHKITLKILKNLRPVTLAQSSSEDNTHYNLISALIKSIRGSDIDAGIYYLARLIHAGENPEFIARRLVILASEDIGNANPHALTLATSTLTTVSKIGYPEARIPLAQCVIYLASCPKSNTAYQAINLALDYVQNYPDLTIPPQILPQNPHYLYPHDFGGFIKQKYLQKPLQFVERTHKGFEKTLNEWLDKITQEVKQ